MFSRSGKATINEYVAFKEAHDSIAEENEDVPEEVVKEQLKADLRGEETNALKNYLDKQIKQVENEKPQDDSHDTTLGSGRPWVRAPELKPQGVRGNLSMFRSVPRQRINAREE